MTNNSECSHCGIRKVYILNYDTYACLNCDLWLEKICGDADCEFCAGRPDRPSDAGTLEVLN